VEWLSRLKLDLEAVDEDASDEVLQFEIQISLIYSKLVGLYRNRIISPYTIPHYQRLFIRIPHTGGLF